jgi:KUP system potassium uptake protein
MSDAPVSASPSKAADPPLPPAAGAGEVHHGHPTGSLLALTIGALGVVYGDIGTSPLYTIKECFTPGHGVEPTTANVLGVLSLIVWSLMLVVGVKYVSFILRADNQGEGGVLALLALVTSRQELGDRDRLRTARRPGGARALRRGPALRRRDHHPRHLRALRRRGPGGRHHQRAPLRRAHHPGHPGGALPGAEARHRGHRAHLRPGHRACGSSASPPRASRGSSVAPRCSAPSTRCTAVRFFYEHGGHGFLLLGSVVLCITGGEALYADMGHFGRKPIRWAWYTWSSRRCSQLHGPGGGAARARRGGAGQPLLRPALRVAGVPDGGGRHGGHGGRLAGPHLRAPSRSPSRRCSSGTAPASPSCTPRAAPRGRSTSPRSTAS